MRSKLEENIADLLEELNVDYEYESEKLSYVIEAKYIPDFKVGDVYLEAKGYFPSDQRRKMKAVKKANLTLLPLYTGVSISFICVPSVSTTTGKNLSPSFHVNLS